MQNQPLKQGVREGGLDGQKKGATAHIEADLRQESYSVYYNQQQQRTLDNDKVGGDWMVDLDDSAVFPLR